MAGAFHSALMEIGARRLERALEAHRFNQRRTAEGLGLSYAQLRGLLKKHGLRPGNEEPRTRRGCSKIHSNAWIPK